MPTNFDAYLSILENTSLPKKPAELEESQLVLLLHPFVPAPILSRLA